MYEYVDLSNINMSCIVCVIVVQNPVLPGTPSGNTKKGFGSLRKKESVKFNEPAPVRQLTRDLGKKRRSTTLPTPSQPQDPKECPCQVSCRLD